MTTTGQKVLVGLGFVAVAAAAYFLRRQVSKTEVISWIIKSAPVLQNRNDSEQTTTETEWTKVKEMRIDGKLPIVRTAFFMRPAVYGTTVYGRVYKNGVPIGTIQSSIADAFVEMAEELGPWNPGDRYQIYACTSDPAVPCRVQWQRLGYDLDIMVPSTNIL